MAAQKLKHKAERCDHGALHLEGISKAFNGKPVLRNITVSLPPGELIGMVGPSGGGKTVLLKILGQVMAPHSGKITAENCAEDEYPSVGFLFQEGALFDSMTVLENVAFPLHMSGRATEISHEAGAARAYEILCAVGLGDAYKKVPGQLSGGMRKRVAIARALVHAPQIVLLDDPTGGLDPVAASVIMDLIRSLHATYLPTMLIASHDLRRLLPAVNRVLGLFDGKIVCDAKPQELERTASPEVLRFIKTRFEFSVLHG